MIDPDHETVMFFQHDFLETGFQNRVDGGNVEPEGVQFEIIMETPAFFQAFPMPALQRGFPGTERNMGGWSAL